MCSFLTSLFFISFLFIYCRFNPTSFCCFHYGDIKVLRLFMFLEASFKFSSVDFQNLRLRLSRSKRNASLPHREFVLYMPFWDCQGHELSVFERFTIWMSRGSSLDDNVCSKLESVSKLCRWQQSPSQELESRYFGLVNEILTL